MTDAAFDLPAPGTLIARTRPLDAEIDLVGFAGPDGWLFDSANGGVAGRGEVLRIPVSTSESAVAASRVHDALASIGNDDRIGVPGCGAIAIGALPFDVGAVGELVIPAEIVGHAPDGTRWFTTIGPRDRLPRHEPDEAHLDDRSPATRFDVSAPIDPSAWKDIVAAVRDEIRARDDLRKVVLAREVIVEADTDIDSVQVLRRLRDSYPSCMLYAADGLVGASPELLVSRSGDVVRSHPLAGTATRSADPTTDARLAAALLASAKDREEHRITIDMVHETLLPWCSYLDEEAEPSIVPMANVQHLGTMVEGRLSAPPASVIELMAALHPTPAVCGDPRGLARELIAEHEGFDRGRYAGPVGWVDAHGNGSWAVGIRCAEITGSRARLFAGVGVVADSDPAAELAETQAKLQAVLGAIVRP